MAVFRRLFALAFVCLASLGVAQLPDQQAAARVLGLRWKQLSRSAGMIFSGTVLSVETQPAGKDRPLPLILTKFRVDRAIAGVQKGQVLPVREWTGAWPTHRAMRGGEHLLIFLYPPSRLGLTSPVGGPLGQVLLSSRGEIVKTSAAEADVDSAAFAARLKSCPPENQVGVGVFPVYGVFPQAQCVGENSVVPPGLESLLPASPALKRWAKLERPSGAGLSESSVAWVNRQQVLAHTLKCCANPSRLFPADGGVAGPPIVTLRQLERAIRSVRKNKE